MLTLKQWNQEMKTIETRSETLLVGAALAKHITAKQHPQCYLDALICNGFMWAGWLVGKICCHMVQRRQCHALWQTELCECYSEMLQSPPWLGLSIVCAPKADNLKSAPMCVRFISRDDIWLQRKECDEAHHVWIEGTNFWMKHWLW